MLIRGHNLHVELHGAPDAPPVILLHHGLGSVRAWKSNIPDLAAAGFRVIAYDRWGYGKSDARPSLGQPYFADDLVDLEQLMSQLEINQAALIGHSDGGTIALYFAAANPQRVTRLVVVAAHIYVEPKMQPGMQMIRHTFENDPDFRGKFFHQHGEKAPSVFKNWYDGWYKVEHLAWDMRPTLSRITCPTLVVQGKDDEHASPQHARDIAAAIPGAHLWLVPGAGHMLPQDCAEVFNRKVIDFLR